MSPDLDPSAPRGGGPLDAAALQAAALRAVDLGRHPGYAAFTTGTVTVGPASGARVTLTTDNPWAANAIRTAFLQADHAVEGDVAHTSTAVIVWAVSHRSDRAEAAVQITEHLDRYERSTFRAEGPDGSAEQQCGHGGHSDLILHARHPFPAAVLAPCGRHGAACWQRSRWPWRSGARHLVQQVLTDTGPCWQLGPAGEQRLRQLYVQHIHATAPKPAVGDTAVAE